MLTQECECQLIPGNGGLDCPGSGECCDECDYLICCTDYNGLCSQCFAENGKCSIAAPQILFLDNPP